MRYLGGRAAARGEGVRQSAWRSPRQSLLPLSSPKTQIFAEAQTASRMLAAKPPVAPGDAPAPMPDPIGARLKAAWRATWPLVEWISDQRQRNSGISYEKLTNVCPCHSQVADSRTGTGPFVCREGSRGFAVLYGVFLPPHAVPQRLQHMAIILLHVPSARRVVATAGPVPLQRALSTPAAMPSPGSNNLGRSISFKKAQDGDALDHFKGAVTKLQRLGSFRKPLSPQTAVDARVCGSAARGMAACARPVTAPRLSSRVPLYWFGCADVAHHELHAPVLGSRGDLPARRPPRPRTLPDAGPEDLPHDARLQVTRPRGLCPMHITRPSSETSASAERRLSCAGLRLTYSLCCALCAAGHAARLGERVESHGASALLDPPDGPRTPDVPGPRLSSHPAPLIPPTCTIRSLLEPMASHHWLRFLRSPPRRTQHFAE